MKILHVLNTGKYSGAENVVITLINSLKDRCDFAYASPDGPIRSILEENDIKFFPMKQKQVNRYELQQIVDTYNPDIIHAHDFRAGIISGLIKKKIPIINHLHNNPPWIRQMGIKTLLYGISCRKYKYILTVSKAVSDEFILKKFINAKMYNVGNPISAKIINAKANEFDVIEKKDIIFVGRLSQQKNPIRFLNIVRKIVDVKPELQISMVGTGELKQDVIQTIKVLNLEKNIEYYGFQINKYPFMKNYNIMSMTSEMEGFCLFAVEGMTLGLPVIAFPVGGLQNIINDTCGKLCASDEEYVEIVLRLLDNSEVYRERSLGAVKRAKEYNNIDQYALNMLNIYNEIKK